MTNDSSRHEFVGTISPMVCRVVKRCSFMIVSLPIKHDWRSENCHTKFETLTKHDSKGRTYKNREFLMVFVASITRFVSQTRKILCATSTKTVFPIRSIYRRI